MIYKYFSEKHGLRFVVLFHKGRKWIKLMDTATFEVYKRPISDTRQLTPYQMKPGTLANRLKKRAAILKRCNVSYPKKQLTHVIKLLREN